MTADRTPIQPFDPSLEYEPFTVIVLRRQAGPGRHGRVKPGEWFDWETLVMERGAWVPTGVETYDETPAEIAAGLEKGTMEVHVVARPVEP